MNKNCPRYWTMLVGLIELSMVLKQFAGLNSSSEMIGSCVGDKSDLSLESGCSVALKWFLVLMISVFWCWQGSDGMSCLYPWCTEPSVELKMVLLCFSSGIAETGKSWWDQRRTVWTSGSELQEAGSESTLGHRSQGFFRVLITDTATNMTYKNVTM